MEHWRRVWREGFAPILPRESLEALAVALWNDDQRLVQGVTTTPPPLMRVQDWPVEAADAIAFCGVIANGGFGKATVGEAEEFFARACFDADQMVGEPAACRSFLNWYDDTPRDEMRRDLLREVDWSLMRRGRSCLPIEVIEKAGPLADEFLIHPDDMTLRGAFADWCDENDEPGAAEYLRGTMK